LLKLLIELMMEILPAVSKPKVKARANPNNSDPPLVDRDQALQIWTIICTISRFKTG
jgi:hypothetical protein